MNFDLGGPGDRLRIIVTSKPWRHGSKVSEQKRENASRCNVACGVIFCPVVQYHILPKLFFPAEFYGMILSCTLPCYYLDRRSWISVLSWWDNHRSAFGNEYIGKQYLCSLIYEHYEEWIVINNRKKQRKKIERNKSESEIKQRNVKTPLELLRNWKGVFITFLYILLFASGGNWVHREGNLCTTML